ncbi:MAG: hypothetical protein NTZ94_01520 [Verrucomicrobia bacterium]|nr:hypothetical protein [Verrucomicrobiota bacterium]
MRRVLDEEVHINAKIAEGFFQSGRVLFTSLEALAAEFPEEVAILPRVGGQSDAEIHIKRGRARQIAVLGEVATEVFGNKTANEHKVCVP